MTVAAAPAGEPVGRDFHHGRTGRGDLAWSGKPPHVAFCNRQPALTMLATVLAAAGPRLALSSVAKGAFFVLAWVGGKTLQPMYVLPLFSSETMLDNRAMAA